MTTKSISTLWQIACTIATVTLFIWQGWGYDQKGPDYHYTALCFYIGSVLAGAVLVILMMLDDSYESYNGYTNSPIKPLRHDN